MKIKRVVCRPRMNIKENVMVLRDVIDYNEPLQ